MKRLRLSRYAKKRLTIAGTLLGVGLMLHSCGEEEPVPEADPAAVQRFLAQLEASETVAGVDAEEKEKDGSEKRIINLVEDAAERAPSEATINRIETVVAGRLG